MGRSATLQRQQLLLPSLGGCPGRHSRQRPPLRSLRLAREESYTHNNRPRSPSLQRSLAAAPLPRPRHQPLLANEVSGQKKPPPLPPPRESGAREDAATRLPLRGAAATRSGQPLRGSCQPAPGWCAPPSVAAAPPLRRAALLLRPTRARPPRRVGLQPPPPRGLEMRGSIHRDAARATIHTTEAVAMRAQSAWTRTQGSERSGARGSEKLGSLLAAAGLSRRFLLSERVGDKVWAEIPQRPPTPLFPSAWTPPAPPRTKDAPASGCARRTPSAACRLCTPGSRVPAGLKLLPHRGSNKSF